MSEVFDAFIKHCEEQQLAVIEYLADSEWLIAASAQCKDGSKVLVRAEKTDPDNVNRRGIQEFRHPLTHPHILQRKSWSSFICRPSVYFVVVSEFADMSLMYEIEKRRESNKRYEEQRIFLVAYQLSSALCYLKSLNFAFCNVHPGAIFLIGDCPKLASLECVEKLGDEAGTTPLHGNSAYWSPALLGAYLRSEQSAYHNPHQSDIYSLGLTLLAMAALARDGEVRKWRESQQIEAVVESLQYSQKLKELIIKMLETDEQSRLSCEEVMQCSSTVDLSPLPPSQRVSGIFPCTLPLPTFDSIVFPSSDLPSKSTETCRICNKPIEKSSHCLHKLCSEGCQKKMRKEAGGRKITCEICRIEIARDAGGKKSEKGFCKNVCKIW